MGLASSIISKEKLTLSSHKLILWTLLILLQLQLPQVQLEDQATYGRAYRDPQSPDRELLKGPEPPQRSSTEYSSQEDILAEPH